MKPNSLIWNKSFDDAREGIRVIDITPEGSDYLTLDVDEASSTTTFVGKQDKDGNWLIMRIDTSSGTSIRYASSKNNPSYVDYTSAWSNRLGLTYGYVSDAL